MSRPKTGMDITKMMGTPKRGHYDKYIAAKAPEAFLCTSLHVKMSRDSCGERHKEVRSKGEKGKTRIGSMSCAHCPVGKAHERGESPTTWPDGSPIVTVRVVPLLGTKKIPGGMP